MSVKYRKIPFTGHFRLARMPFIMKMRVML